MQLKTPANVTCYPAVSQRTQQQQQTQAKGLEKLFAKDTHSRGSSNAGLGCLGSFGGTAVCISLTVTCPEVPVTTGLACTGAAPTMSSVDCHRGVPINTTMGESIAAAKEWYADFAKKD